MQMTHPFEDELRTNIEYGRELQDEARALQEAIENRHWPDLTREQCERLLDILTDAML